MKRHTHWFHFAIVVLAGGLAATPAHALFEDLALSPRARAMGEATVATTNDAWAFYYNPAMLPLVPVAQAELTTVTPNGLSFNRLSSAGLAAPLPGRGGALAVGWRRYAVEFEEVDLTSENTLSVAHGFRLFADASTAAYLGWTLNFYNATFSRTIGLSGDGTDGVEPGSAWAVGLDVGAVVKVYDRTRLGFFTRNLNSPTIGDDSEELSRQVGVGLAYEPYPGVISAFDMRTTLGDRFRFCGGLEFNVVAPLDLRVGVETEPNKLSGGFGIHLPVLTLDYGFSTGGGVLDASHHFGVALRWDKLGSEAKP